LCEENGLAGLGNITFAEIKEAVWTAGDHASEGFEDVPLIHQDRVTIDGIEGDMTVWASKKELH
jgi:hypothetical protein